MLCHFATPVPMREQLRVFSCAESETPAIRGAEHRPRLTIV